MSLRIQSLVQGLHISFAGAISRFHSTQSSSEAAQAVVAIGANIGNRLQNILEALKRLEEKQIKILRYSRLYESAAAYVTDQPAFLNAAVAVQTQLDPHLLLKSLKDVEAAAGRDFQGRRWGPRPLDLDIIFYGSELVQSEALQIPHARWQERDFVKAPLSDLYTKEELQELTSPLSHHLQLAQSLWLNAGGEQQLGDDSLKVVLPLQSSGRNWSWQGRTQVMGILNVTPDSFSDGGLSSQDLSAAVDAAKRLADDGADIIDIGGQSTRPGAAFVAAEEECSRVVPLIRALRQDESLADVLLSVDTFQSTVAREAVAAGADIVNDVSGGLLDAEMFATVADLQVPYIMMHMRGTPQTMASRENTSYSEGQLASEAGAELQERVDKAIGSGIEPWRIITDPGIGFAKTHQGNVELLRDLPKFRQKLQGCVRGQPMLVGSSRKGFLGKLTGRHSPKDRDLASAVAASLSIAGGANIIRMHDAAAGIDAARVSDAILKTDQSAQFTEYKSIQEATQD